jgi:hypothetical protein
MRDKIGVIDTSTVFVFYCRYLYIPLRLLGCLFVYLMLFIGSFNNISVISWRSVLLVEETGVPGENHRPVASH